MVQLLKLADSWQGYDVFSVTTTEVIRERLKKYGTVYVVGECNRRYPVRVIKVLMQSIKIVFRERPSVVISTGAAVGYIICFLSKLGGAKVVWIDSITNVKRMSLSGRMIRFIADLTLVQWPELTKQYKGVEYIGTLV
jgi:UDP-N-acetylglucosamine:LPS N-acetylglucosamine transferase